MRSPCGWCVETAGADEFATTTDARAFVTAIFDTVLFGAAPFAFLTWCFLFIVAPYQTERTIVNNKKRNEQCGAPCAQNKVLPGHCEARLNPTHEIPPSPRAGFSAQSLLRSRAAARGQCTVSNAIACSTRLGFANAFHTSKSERCANPGARGYCANATFCSAASPPGSPAPASAYPASGADDCSAHRARTSAHHSSYRSVAGWRAFPASAGAPWQTHGARLYRR